MKTWLRKHGASSAEVPVYVSHLRELLNQPDVLSYNQKREEFEVVWSRSFKDYYMKEVDPEVLQTFYYFKL